MLSLLRLPSFRSLRDENSRNPALTAGAMLISPILFIASRPRLLVPRRADAIGGLRVLIGCP